MGSAPNTFANKYLELGSKLSSSLT